ncbi:MAG: DUF3768 domain-containing protein [Rhizobium sp.]|nr:DUF3768 domain-containing protein [Rhizobium sp.]
MASQADMDKAERTRTLNDAFRRDPRQGGVVLTTGVGSLSPDQLAALLAAIRNFADFTAENDPYEEHDFAAVTVDGERYLFKIDYYDLDLRYGSPDPSDPAFTQRVMTVMRADEY